MKQKNRLRAAYFLRSFGAQYGRRGMLEGRLKLLALGKSNRLVQYG